MDYLSGKWKMWHKFLDVNSDGQLSMDDVEDCRKKFSELHKLGTDKAKTVKDAMEEWWKKYIFQNGSKTEIDVDQFVQHLKTDYEKDKDTFKNGMEKCFQEIFKVIDTNNDKSIELDEFIFAFKAFGHENEALLKKAFENFKSSGAVPIRDIVSAWVQFVCDTDEKKTDVIRDAFKSGV